MYPKGYYHGPVIWYLFKYVLCNSDINIYNHAGDCISFAGSSINVIEDTLNKEIVSLMKWFRKKSLAANPAKFQTMLVKNNNINDIELNVTADNVYRPRTHWQYLGIGTDDRLNFEGQDSNICINVLQRLKDFLDQDSHMTIYEFYNV